jgi:hypothetical protein
MEKRINGLTHEAERKKISCRTLTNVVIYWTRKTCDINFFTAKQR